MQQLRFSTKFEEIYMPAVGNEVGNVEVLLECSITQSVGGGRQISNISVNISTLTSTNNSKK